MKYKLTVFLIFFSIIRSYASSDTLHYNSGLVLLENSIKYIEDPTNKLNIDQIIAKGNFKKTKEKIPNFKVSESNYWLKIIVNNKANKDIFIDISYPTLDNVTIYKTQKGKVISTDSLGELHSFYFRKNDYTSLIFALNLKKNETCTYYLKINSGKQIIVPLSIGTEKDIINDEANKGIAFGIYGGIILAMFLYNVFLFISTRDKSYLFYVIYIFFVSITQATLNGYSHKYLWPNLPWLSERATQLCGSLSGISTILFVKNFLSTQKNSPKFNKVLNVFIGLYLVSIILTIFHKLQESYNMINAVAGIGSIMLLFFAIYLYKTTRYSPALFFIIAWSVFIISIVIFVLKDTRIIPYNVLTVTGLQIGSAIELLLLSFALADKINIYRKEKETSQAETLKAVQENARIISEQNVILETKVTERTAELQASNTGLHKALVDLKEAESQLVEAEKMASLGQLTAGIAHEINNPINFVTSNVAPLKRDIEMLFDTIATIEEVGLSEDSNEEKQNQIVEYKEEIDFDYLKLEIGHLLKGIHEGASRTAEIVKGLRVFSRLDEDDIKQADINEGLESTLVIANNLLNNKIQLIKQYGDIPFIECYPGKLNQVFLNIISNAIYAIKKRHVDKPGGILKIITYCDDNNLFIKIEDNGIGMDEITKKKIFEPFFTTKPVGEGTGLGMSITYNTIKKHNGQIHINSTPGIGTEFIIELQLHLETQLQME